MIFFCFSKSQKHIEDKGWDKIVENFYENAITDEVKEDLKMLVLILIVLLILLTFLHFLQNR